MLLELLSSDLLDNFSRVKSFDLDVSKKDGKFLIEAHLPSFSKEEISVELNGKYLEITAKSKKTEDKDYLFRESSSELSRSLSLGNKVNTDTIKANFENGKLLITFEEKETSIKIM